MGTKSRPASGTGAKKPAPFVKRHGQCVHGQEEWQCRQELVDEGCCYEKREGEHSKSPNL